MNDAMKALVLDFDGVISDSAPEAFVVALHTYATLQPQSSWSPIAARLRPRGGLTRTDVLDEPLYGRFLELMPLGNRAEDYAVILSLLEREVIVADQAAYDRARGATSSDWLQRFHQRFYAVREQFASENSETWRALMDPYSLFVAILRRHAQDDVTLAIATAKDRSSVLTLLADYGLSDLFPPDRVLDKETGASKASHLEHLHHVLGFPYPDLTFLDDKVNHLDAVVPLGVRGAFATWGYNGARERHIAEERGYLICTLDDVEEKLFG
jgi:phosphoglycolate phosphatase-like HAD superfamily hydrolase